MRALTALTAGAIAALVATGAVAADIPQELADALDGKFKGTTVTAFGAFADADEVKFNENVKAFEEATGIDIQ
jgi:alpha-glucoside transport system substrate-binding protein